MTSNEEVVKKLELCAQIFSSYLTRYPENKVRDIEWEVIKTICDYLNKHLKS